MQYHKIQLLIIIALIGVHAHVSAQETSYSDKEKIIEASTAYVESIYTVDTVKVYKYVDRELFKKGVYYSKKEKTWSVHPMSFDELVSTAKTYNKKGALPKNSPKVVEILDIQEKIANVKIEAIWGIDYLLLMKDETGNWRITQILWQSYTPQQWESVIVKMKSH